MPCGTADLAAGAGGGARHRPGQEGVAVAESPFLTILKEIEVRDDAMLPAASLFLISILVASWGRPMDMVRPTGRRPDGLAADRHRRMATRPRGNRHRRHFPRTPVRACAGHAHRHRRRCRGRCFRDRAEMVATENRGHRAAGPRRSPAPFDCHRSTASELIAAKGVRVMHPLMPGHPFLPWNDKDPTVSGEARS